VLKASVHARAALLINDKQIGQSHAYRVAWHALSQHVVNLTSFDASLKFDRLLEHLNAPSANDDNAK
jgi:hypothetical protein